MSHDEPVYLVTGATGNVGREVVRALLDRGEPVRGLVRSGSARLPTGAEPVTGDLYQPSSVGQALAGVRGLFLLPGYPDMPEIVARAAEAGVRRIVLLSGASAGSGDRSNAITAYMIDSEEAVRSGPLSWTIIRPSAFASNALRWRDQLAAGDVVTEPFADVRTAVTHPADIGLVAAIALTASGADHDRATYRISGPEATTPAERVAVLANVLDRPLTFRPQTDDEARVAMAATMPQEYVDAFFDFYVAGSLDESPVLPTVQELTGRPARTFRDWAVEHADDFR